MKFSCSSVIFAKNVINAVLDLQLCSNERKVNQSFFRRVVAQTKMLRRRYVANWIMYRCYVVKQKMAAAATW